MAYLSLEMICRFDPLSKHRLFEFLNRGHIDLGLYHLRGCWLLGLLRNVIKVRMVVVGRLIQVSGRRGGHCRSRVLQLGVREYLRMFQGWKRPL